jgi:class 3 adenylate cyclase
MLQRVLSPVLVGRLEELSQLEDALLSANRGDGRFVLLAGEAGIGKTRLATELTRRARKLGCDVLWGSCSEAELPLPYLPFVEAVGNHLGEQDPVALREALGPTAGELAQLFPQLAERPPSAPEGDAAQAKLRLFESVVTLLELWAQDRGLLLVLDDVHWADSSTRELLDYAARRLARSRVMLLATYRSDELDRRHPLTRAVQVWRRAGLAETVAVAAMTSADVTEMVAAILNAEEVSPTLVGLVGERAEGNPFVLEEMLREAIDRGEIVWTEAGWRQGAVDTLRMPETVREAVLLRLGRLEPDWVEVLRSAAVLGRSFEYGLLLEVAEADESRVLAALEAAVAQQLIEEEAEVGQRYTWRHALTQEAIVGDAVVPKRQRIHSRAADALVRTEGSARAVARHLLGAGRTEEAVDACLRAADEAERAIAFSEAAELLERVLPYVGDPRERGALLARMGHLRWLNGEPTAGEQLLADGVAQLHELGEEVEAAKARIHLGRCRWELDQPEAAFRDYEAARDVLEKDGPSPGPELALAYLRIAGLHAFQLDYDACLTAAQRAFEIAEEASADFERLWSLTHVALGYFGTSREFEILDRCYTEALEKGYGLIAGNTLYNEIWDRVHTLTGGLGGPLEKLEHIPSTPWMSSGGTTAKGLALLAVGRLREALETARRATARHESLGASKFAWRSRLVAAEALLELGRAQEAAAELPPPSPGSELQDIVYDTAARVGIALELGRLEEAAELGRRAAGDETLTIFRETAGIAIEAFVANGALDEAWELLARTKAARADLGSAGIDLAEGRLLLAAGKPAEARPHFEGAMEAFEQSGLGLWHRRAMLLAAEAADGAGERDAARELLVACLREAHEAGAGRVKAAGQALAARLGLEVPAFADEQPQGEPDFLAAGERLVTSMFADVRGYTPLASASAPEELADRITTLHRWAAAEVGRRYGIVDKFAGDAVMATFNAAGTRVDHAVLALDAALAIRDKAALMDLPVGIGIAVGPAVVTRSVGNANVSVLGEATNLAARLESVAGGGEILLSDEAFRRVGGWLAERGLAVEREELELKGFDGPQPAYRLASFVPAAAG